MYLKKYYLLTILLWPIILPTASGNAQAGNMINYKVENHSILQPLNGLAGDPDRGRLLVRNKNKGNCLSCHQLPIPEDDFHGTIGPSLYTIADKFNAAQLRIRIADMKLINPFTIMPGYYKSTKKINRIAAQYAGKTILSAQQLEDIIAYLLTLKATAKETMNENQL